MALMCGLAAYPLVVGGQLFVATVPLAAFGALFSLAALFFRPSLVGPAVLGLAAEYVVVEATGHAGSLSVIAYAVGLIVMSELLLWIDPLSQAARISRPVLLSGIVGLLAAGGCAAVLALLTLSAGLVTVGGFEWALVGGAAAIVLALLPLILVKRGEGARPPKTG